MEQKIVTILSAGADAKGIIRPVTVEVEVTNGIGIHLVGLADAAVKESLLRTVTALQALDYHIPGKKLIINIAPPTMYKRGSNYDLPIAIGILIASGQISVDSELLNRCVFSGELGLDGTLRTNEDNNGFAIALSAMKDESVKALVTSVDTAIQAAPLTWIFPYGFDNLAQIIKVIGDPDGTASDFLIWNRKEWHKIEDAIDDNRNAEYPL